MNNDQLVQQIRHAISETTTHIDAAAIPLNQTFSQAGLDSLDQVQVIVALEDLHGLVIEEEDVDHMHCISDLVDYFAQRSH